MVHWAGSGEWRDLTFKKGEYDCFVCLYVHCMHSLPLVARRDGKVPWNWFLATMWVLAFESGSPRRAATALWAKPSSQCPRPCLFLRAFTFSWSSVLPLTFLAFHRRLLLHRCANLLVMSWGTSRLKMASEESRDNYRYWRSDSGQSL